MTKKIFIETILEINYKISNNQVIKGGALFKNAMFVMSKEDAEILALIDVNADDKLWKVINNITECLNNHAV